MSDDAADLPAKRPPVPHLTTQEARELEDQKKQTRYMNEVYLRDHPELGEIVSSFNAKILQHQPTNTKQIIDFAVQHFTKDIFQE